MAPTPQRPASERDVPVQLTAFEVSATSDTSYGALNSNSITRFNVELDRLPISADVLTEALIRDTAAMSVEELILKNSAGAGYAAADESTTPTGLQPGDRNSGASLRLRGLASPTLARDGFMPNVSVAGGFSSSFDVERVDVINGPQALLYGSVGGGGVVNIVSKQARIGKKPFGSFRYTINQYGGQAAQFDLGASHGRAAVRIAGVQQDWVDRRDWIGGKMGGIYAQVAVNVFKNTVVRLSAEHTDFDRVTNASYTFTAVNAANDARNGQNLRYLLATNQLERSAAGASGAGFIGNGHLNWDNIDSLSSWWNAEPSRVQFTNLSVETQWSKMISTQLSAGYINHWADRVDTAPTFYAPNHASNPLGTWAIGYVGSNPMASTVGEGERRGVRYSVLMTNELFGRRVKSQTVIGADYLWRDASNIRYGYWRADENWNILVNPVVAANAGRTIIPGQFFSIANGPVYHPHWKPGTARVTLNGVNYVRDVFNPRRANLVSESNPLGITTLGGQPHNITDGEDKGIYGVNHSQWLNGRLDTLAGFRVARTFLQTFSAGSATTTGDNGTHRLAEADTVSFNVGLNYRLTSWLTPYAALSNSNNPPGISNNDPLGNEPQVSKAQGMEVGVKASNRSGTVSGSVAIYATNSKNEQYTIQNTLQLAINPNGLNGRFGPAPSSVINVDRKSKGVQLALTAAPTKGWRMRFTAATVDGKLGNTTSYEQLYNDEFRANAQGQVTYADGTPVYVPATFSTNNPVVTAGTAGAQPLTIAMLSTPGNSYFANPDPISGAINTGSNGARVLRVVDPVRGAILTGRTGLPISAIQVTPPRPLSGTIVTSEAGEFTAGYPKISLNATNMYAFSEGRLKGLSLGATVSAGWYNRNYYYFPNGVSVGAQRKLFSLPTQTRVDGIIGYSFRFRRLTFNTQLNIQNLFNRYDIAILPNAVSGYAGPNNANFTQQPRVYLWSNGVSF